jgi:hypothetical protein
VRIEAQPVLFHRAAALVARLEDQPMLRSIRSLPWIVALLAPLALAQPGQFDWLVGGGPHGNAIKAFRWNGTMTMNVPLASAPSAITMDADNDAILAVAGGRLLRGYSNGLVLTVSPVTGLTSVDVDEDGNYVATMTSAALGHALLRIAPDGVATTVATGLVQPGSFSPVTGVRWDVDTGDAVVGIYKFVTEPSLLRVARSGAKSTLTAFLFEVRGLDQDVVTGDFVVASQGALTRVGPAGALSTLLNTCSANLMEPYAVRVAPVGYPYPEYRVGATFQSSQLAPACNLPLNRSTVQTWSLTNGGELSTIVDLNTGCSGNCTIPLGTYQGRGLSGAGPATPGSVYQLRLRLPAVGYQNKNYALSGSFGARPGFQLPDTRRVNLAIDALYWLTTLNQAPAIWQGFQGVLDRGGDANAGVLILDDPALLGLRTYYASVVDAAFPSAIQYLSNTHAFTIRP